MISRIASLFLLCLSLVQTGIGSYADHTSLGGTLYLVNRTYRLTQAYEPDDLVELNVRKLTSGIQLRREAAGMLEELFNAAKEMKMTLVAVSGYRSYDRQDAIFRRKQRTSESLEKAMLLVAPPGASEHQLGLALDIARRDSANLNGAFGKSKEGLWLKENAHHFGFIIRYKAEWTAITGYADEPWHIRYVGKEHAQAIYSLNIPLETYVEKLAIQAFGEYFTDD